jgi:hypothetical protein
VICLAHARELPIRGPHTSRNGLMVSGLGWQGYCLSLFQAEDLAAVLLGCELGLGPWFRVPGFWFARKESSDECEAARRSVVTCAATMDFGEDQTRQSHCLR